MVKIRARTEAGAQTSIDFLTGMTLFILTLVFSFTFLVGMVQPYSSTAGDSIQAADRASDRLYTDTFTSPGASPGEFNYTEFSEFFEDTSEDEKRSIMGLPEVNSFNLTVSSDYTGYGPRDSMLAYWPLNERGSEEAQDIAGPLGGRLNGETEGDVETDVRGVSSSGAYRFDDNRAAVNVTNDSALNPADTGNMTLSAWVKPEGPQPEFATIAAKGYNNGYQMHLDSSSGSRYPTFEQGSGAEAQWTNPLNDGEWYHIVGVYKNLSSGNYLEMHVNGDLKDNSSGTIAAASGDNLGIGKNLQRPPSATPNNRHFNGTIDEVRLYSRALSESEIRGMYESAGVLSPDKPDPSAGDTLVNTTYTAGDEPPSGQDVASVSSRRRVGYIPSDVGTSRDAQRAEFFVSPSSPVVGDSLNEINVDYPASVNITPLADSCPSGGPCSLVTVGIDGNGDGAIDPGRDASGDVNDVIADSDDTDLQIRLNGNYNIQSDDSIVAEYPLSDPDAEFGCENADVTINEDGATTTTLNVCGDGSDASSDIGTVEIDLKVW